MVAITKSPPGTTGIRKTLTCCAPNASESRFNVAGEFKTMMAVVDSISADVRPRISSIWCDSRAGCVYSVEVVLGMNQASLPGQIRECFRRATKGFNGLAVGHGSQNEVFDPEWPDFYIEDDRIAAQLMRALNPSRRPDFGKETV